MIASTNETGTCRTCSSELPQAGVTVCPHCTRPHHVDCWNYSGCSTFGCVNSQSKPPPQATPASTGWSYRLNQLGQALRNCGSLLSTGLTSAWSWAKPFVTINVIMALGLLSLIGLGIAYYQADKRQLERGCDLVLARFDTFDGNHDGWLDEHELRLIHLTGKLTASQHDDLSKLQAVLPEYDFHYGDEHVDGSRAHSRPGQYALLRGDILKQRYGY